jgi:hypothetical protein
MTSKILATQTQAVHNHSQVIKENSGWSKTAGKVVEFLTRIEETMSMFFILAGVVVAILWSVPIGLIGVGAGTAISLAVELCCASQTVAPTESTSGSEEEGANSQTKTVEQEELKEGQVATRKTQATLEEPILEQGAGMTLLVQAVAFSQEVLPADELLLEAAFRINYFDKGLWERYIGNPGEMPPLPANFKEVLEQPCPFWPNKTIGETHSLVLVPKEVEYHTYDANGHQNPASKPLTLETLEFVVRHGKNGGGSNITYQDGVNQSIRDNYWHKEIEKSRWVLITNEPILESLNKTYEENKHLLAARGYEMPSALDVAAFVLLNNLSGDAFFTETWTHCKNQGLYPTLTVGSFKQIGPSLGTGLKFFANSDRGEPSKRVGVAGVRIFV